MRNKVIIGVFLLSMIVLVLAFKYRQKNDAEQAKVLTPIEHAPASAPIPSDSLNQELPQDEIAVETLKDPQFQNWIREEAKSLDDLNVNGEQKQAQIKEILAKITPSQAQQLRQTVVHPRSPAREKILSAYLLVEGGLSTRQALKDSITAPLTAQGDHEAHSEGELKGIREKSVRIMMIDGLYAQAQKDPSARATLAQAIADSGDPYIKAYAQSKLDQLQQQ